MKKPMRKALRCAGWAALTAGTTLATAAHLPAQSPYRPARGEPGLPARTSAMVPVVVSPEWARLEVGRVTLAWLADPTLFPLHLSAQVRNGKLEVTGDVPTPEVGELALRLAREHASLEVVDGLRIHGRPTLPCCGVSPAALHVTARRLVADKLGTRRAAGVHVEARPDGQVVLAGAVATFEDKVALSQHLHRAAGCTSVLNQLRVLQGDNGQAIAQVKHTEAPALPSRPVQQSTVAERLPAHVPAPALPVSAAPVQEPITVVQEKQPPVTPPAPATPIVPPQASGPAGSQAPLPSLVVPPAQRTTAPVAEAVVRAGEPTGGTARSAPVLQAVGTPPGATTEVLSPPASSRPAPAFWGGTRSSTTVPTAALPVAPGSTTEVLSEPAPSRPAPAFWGGTRTPRPSSQREEPRRQVGSGFWGGTPRQSPATPQPFPEFKEEQGQTARLGGSAEVISASQRMAMQQPSPVAVPGDSYVATGVVTLGSAAPGTVQRSERDGEQPDVYVTTGVVAFGPAESPAPALQPAERLKQSVEKVCGNKASHVQVKALSPSSYLVEITVKSEAEAVELASKIFDLPELGPYHVDLKTHLLP